MVAIAPHFFLKSAPGILGKPIFLASSSNRGSPLHMTVYNLLAEFFSREVFSLLLREDLISKAVVEKIMAWRHAGFNVHSQVRAKTRQEAERVGKYMIRPLLSLERLSFSEKEGQVCCRYGEGAEEVERMDYLEFIARTTSHIPDKGRVTLRYYGLYANAHRGKVRKGQPDRHPFIIFEEGSPGIPRRGWAEMIRKVLRIDINNICFL